MAIGINIDPDGYNEEALRQEIKELKADLKEMDEVNEDLRKLGLGYVSEIVDLKMVIKYALTHALPPLPVMSIEQTKAYHKLRAALGEK